MEAKTLDGIRVRGFELLVESLGPADAIRFIRSYSRGSGDYTRECKAWLEQGLDTVVAGVLGRRKREGRRWRLHCFSEG